MATIHDFMKCPKCSKQFLGKSVHPEFGKEYFCHHCHIYFGVNELVNMWGYDAADLSPVYPVTHADYKGWKNNFPIMEPEDEPIEFVVWDTWEDYVEAYEMAGRMLMNIPEMDDYLDLKQTQEYALQVGIQ